MTTARTIRIGNRSRGLPGPPFDALSGFVGSSVEEDIVSREGLVPSISGGGRFLSANGHVIILTLICCCDAI
jgi:hypothetical protein